MNTTGMTELGNENNVKPKGFFQRMRNTFKSRKSAQMRQDEKTAMSRKKQNLNSVRAQGNSRKRQRRKELDRNFVERKIGEALMAQYDVQQIIDSKRKFSRGEHFIFDDTRAIAQKEIFTYINKYMSLRVSYLSNIETLLNYTLERFRRLEPSYDNKTVIWMLQQETGPYSFWDHILPKDEGKLKEMAEEVANEMIKSENEIGMNIVFKEKNPMMQPPVASTLPLPNTNFEPLALNGGRRHVSRRKASRKSKTRKH